MRFASLYDQHTMGEDELAQLMARSNTRALDPAEIEAWQRAIDSNLIWQMPREFGVAALALIEKKICTRARRSYSGARVARLSINWH